MLAFGSKCSIGDQLHPSGAMDTSTYGLIGAAYAEVEAKEAWCDATDNIADVGLLSSVAASGQRGGHDDPADADTGATRVLLEGHALFDVIDTEMDFGRYRLLILPDEVRVDDAVKMKLDAYLADGGRLLLTGTSGLAPDGSGPRFDLGARWQGESEFAPDYILPDASLRPDWIDQPLVMYAKSQRILPEAGRSLGEVYDPFFNRDYRPFCSHQHAPPQTEPSGFACGVEHGPITYLAHPVFSLYRGTGAVAYKDYALRVIRGMLDRPTVEADLPSTARLTLRDQPDRGRRVLHLLYANTINRGGAMQLAGGTLAGRTQIEVIDELLPLPDVSVTVRSDRPIEAVTLQPQGRSVDFRADGNTVRFTVPSFVCHQMVELKG